MGREIGYRFENGFNGMFRWGNAYSVHRGGSKDGRRMISAAGILLWAVLLSGCGQGMGTGIVQTADSHVQAAGTAPQESPVSGAESAADQAESSLWRDMVSARPGRLLFIIWIRGSSP